MKTSEIILSIVLFYPFLKDTEANSLQDTKSFTILVTSGMIRWEMKMNTIIH